MPKAGKEEEVSWRKITCRVGHFGRRHNHMPSWSLWPEASFEIPLRTNAEEKEEKMKYPMNFVNFNFTEKRE